MFDSIQTKMQGQIQSKREEEEDKVTQSPKFREIKIGSSNGHRSPMKMLSHNSKIQSIMRTSKSNRDLVSVNHSSLHSLHSIGGQEPTILEEASKDQSKLHIWKASVNSEIQTLHRPTNMNLKSESGMMLKSINDG